MDEELRLRMEMEGYGKTLKEEDRMKITSPFLEEEKGKIPSLKRKKEGMKKFKVSHQRRNRV